jgi:hypothetical protein
MFTVLEFTNVLLSLKYLDLAGQTDSSALVVFPKLFNSEYNAFHLNLSIMYLCCQQGWLPEKLAIFNSFIDLLTKAVLTDLIIFHSSQIWIF